MEKIIDYDKIIILLYIKSYFDTYSYEEIKNCLGFSYIQLDEIIGSMINDKMLRYNEKFLIEIDEDGLNLLEELNLRDVQFDDIISDYESDILECIQIEGKLEIKDIFIPKNFQKKFKGYSNKELS